MQMFGDFFQHETSFPTITITNNSFFFLLLSDKPL